MKSEAYKRMQIHEEIKQEVTDMLNKYVNDLDGTHPSVLRQVVQEALDYFIGPDELHEGLYD